MRTDFSIDEVTANADEMDAIRKWKRREPIFPIPDVSFKTSLKIAKYYVQNNFIEQEVVKDHSFNLVDLIDNPPRECLVEISGMFSSGKSQILLQIAAKLPSIFIGTEDRFRIERFKGLGGIDVLIKVTHCLIDFIYTIRGLEDLLTMKSYRTILVDSMHMVREPILAASIGKSLKELAIKFGVTVLFTNQVRSTFDDPSSVKYHLPDIQSITPKAMDAFIEHKLVLYRLDVVKKPLGFSGMDHQRVLVALNSRSNPTVLDAESDNADFLQSRCVAVSITPKCVLLQKWKEILETSND